MSSSTILKEDIDSILENRDLFAALQGCTVLITGVTGLIGSMILRVLTAENDANGAKIKIIGQARSRQKAEEVLDGLVDRPDVEVVYSDTFNFDVQCDYIIHTASPTASKYFVEHPVETIDVSIQGTRKMLELAARNQVKGMVYLSSMEEYGEPYDTAELVTEDKCGFIDHLSVRSCYPQSKRMCECYCASYAAEYGVRVTIARLAQTFGAGVPLSDNRLFMQMARSVKEGTNIVLHTEGRSVSNFCYLSDSVEGILTVLLKGAAGEAYNVCNEKETRTVWEIAEMVAERIAGGNIGVVVDIPETTVYGYAPDVTLRLCSEKLRLLGWIPKINMEESYKRLVAYLHEK